MIVIDKETGHICLGHHTSVHHTQGVKQELKVQINLYCAVVALWHYLRGERADPKGSSGWKSRIELRPWKEEVWGMSNMWIQMCLRIWEYPHWCPVISDTDALLQHQYPHKTGSQVSKWGRVHPQQCFHLWYVTSPRGAGRDGSCQQK